MIRGTTPTHTFTLPFEREEIAALCVTYAQRGIPLFTKSEADCTFAGNAVTLQLTQSDTLRFVAQDAVQIQVRVLDNKGVAYASRVLITTVEDCLLEEVIT